MTPLRNNLDRAKTDYGEIRYRGDLARDVLGAMPSATPTNLWPRRLLAIAAAVALSATTFFAGRYFSPAPGGDAQVVAINDGADTNDTKANQNNSTPNVFHAGDGIASGETATANASNSSTAAGEFTLVPQLASASASNTTSSAQANTSASAGYQQSMDFSHSVPSAPMLFSLASLADQESENSTQNQNQNQNQGGTETENRS